MDASPAVASKAQQNGKQFPEQLIRHTRHLGTINPVSGNAVLLVGIVHGNFRFHSIPLGQNLVLIWKFPAVTIHLLQTSNDSLNFPVFIWILNCCLGTSVNLTRKYQSMFQLNSQTPADCRKVFLKWRVSQMIRSRNKMCCEATLVEFLNKNHLKKYGK